MPTNNGSLLAGLPEPPALPPRLTDKTLRTTLAEMVIPGKPCSTPRARATVINGHATMYTSEDGEIAAAHAASAMAPQRPEQPYAGAVGLRVVFYFPVKTGGPAWWHACALGGRLWRLVWPRSKRRNDIDNCLKLVMDAMTRVGFWEDDGQVCEVTMRKCYDRQPRTEVKLYALPEVNSAAEWKALGSPGGEA